jgi:hypothetical protein
MEDCAPIQEHVFNLIDDQRRAGLTCDEAEQVPTSTAEFLTRLRAL